MKTKQFAPYVLTLVAGVLIGLVLAALPDGHRSGRTERKADRPVTESTTPKHTQDNKVVVDLTLIESLPARKSAAAALCQPTDKDSTPVIFEKEMKYYETLKSYVTLLRQTYYLHDHFPTNMCEGIEEHATVLAGIEYPFHPSTGSSAYDGLCIRQGIRMTDDLIVRMARSIVEATARQGVIVTGNKQIDFTAWKQEWDAHQPSAQISSPLAGSKR